MEDKPPPPSRGSLPIAKIRLSIAIKYVRAEVDGLSLRKDSINIISPVISIIELGATLALFYSKYGGAL